MNKLSEMFSDGKQLSWTRIVGLPIVIVGLFGFVWSIILKFDSGMMYSIAAVTLGCGLKGVQTKFETDQLKIGTTDSATNPIVDTNKEGV